jgi:hypothetical protein
MKKSALTAILLLLFGGFVASQSIPSDSLYFGQTPPGTLPQLFAPGIVSLPGRNEATITFSPDGASVFFYIEKYPAPGNPYTLFSTYTNNHWTAPDTIPFTVGRSTGEPFFAFNGNRVYMFATNATNHAGITDLSYSVKQGTNWTDPVSLGNPPNSESYQYHPCIVGDTSVYFSSSSGSVCRCQYTDGTYAPRVILPKPVNFIGAQTWGDPYVAPDESYLIMKSIREEGYGQNDLYIAYKKPDGSWTNPKNLGNIINTPNDETSGDITPDGLYMTYGSNKDLYWVSTSFIDSLRYTNYRPYVKNLIPDQSATAGQYFNMTLPDSIFFDDDGNHTLSYSSRLSNGNPLPDWLTFDSLGQTFSGTPADVQVLNIRVTATDTAGAMASTTFKITVRVANFIDPAKDGSVAIYPNPTSGVLTLSKDEPAGKTFAEIRTLEGKLIMTTTFTRKVTLDLSSHPKGLYVIKLWTDRSLSVKKICLR